MKELNLDDLSPEAQESVKTVFSMLTGTSRTIHVYQGERFLYTLSKAADNEIEPGVFKGNDQPEDNPADDFEKLGATLSEAVPEVSAEEIRQKAWTGRGV